MNWWRDIRQAVRLARLQAGHTLAVIVIMALGIGATTTLFSVAYGVLWKPLPWPHPERLIRITETRAGATRNRPWTTTNAVFLAWLEQHSTVDALAAWTGPGKATLTGTGEASFLNYASVSASMFQMLEARPAAGSLFRRDAEIPNPNVIVISYGTWQRQFGGDSQVIGHTIQLDSKPFTIVGVMSPDFVFPDRETQAWAPLYVAPVVGPDGNGRHGSFLNVMARLTPGTTPAQAAAEATARGRTGPDLGLTAVAMFGSSQQPQITAVSALQALTGEVRPALVVFLIAVGLLLATATANIANLQLARSSTRRREMAIRSAIGASAGRLARQLIVENALLGSVAGVLGLLLTVGTQSALPALLPADFPRSTDIGINAMVMLFAAGITICISLACGLWPALHMLKLNLVESLVEQGSDRSGARPCG